jgi:hypothetical protein
MERIVGTAITGAVASIRRINKSLITCSKTFQFYKCQGWQLILKLLPKVVPSAISVNRSGIITCENQSLVVLNQQQPLAVIGRLQVPLTLIILALSLLVSGGKANPVDSTRGS